jgi:DNA-binding transcriptional MerR regulator/methylmalonyl-CoA mutase cobalamin-binding subunit
MTSNPKTPQLMLNITAVERDTRIGKDALRVWERRYGFPQPERDTNGERLYPPEQVERLRVIKRLLDAGHRPGRVVALELAQLHELSDALKEPVNSTSLTGNPASLQQLEITQLLDLLKTHDPAQLRRRFSQQIMRIGLARFVMDIATPLMRDVGKAWASGDLHIFEEHLCSEVLETSLRAALATAPEPAANSRPRVLLSTVPGESHSLSILMAEALFLVEGCSCMNLGSQTPLHDMLNAANAHRSDIVAISFSAASNPGQSADALSELRAMLPAPIELWAGSPHSLLQRRDLPGVKVMAHLEDIPAQVQRWRQQS